MKKFDLLIADCTTPQPYERQTLEVQALGGTEATVIRVAEGLAALGAHVGVLEHNLQEPLMGENAFYLPLKMIDEVDTHNFISLRGTHFLDRFPTARKFSWHEDVGTPETFGGMREAFVQHNVTVVAASHWHMEHIRKFVHIEGREDNPRVTYIYNPVEDHLFVPKGVNVKYDRNKLCWVASPHKGLKEGLEIFNRLVEVSGNRDYRLYTFNPGYLMHDLGVFNNRNIVDIGPIPCRELWQHVSESLCLFYPTTFEETFGNIAAEANAVHTPVLTCKIAALAETVSSPKQFVPVNDPDAVIERVMEWHSGKRPKVWGNEEFRLTNVLKSWVRLLSGRIYL